MALNWEELKDTSDTDPPITAVYGGGGLGKTTLASEWPAPFYVRTGEGERAPKGVTMKSFGVSDTYADVIDQADWMLEAEHDQKTFVVDALDGLEGLIRTEACARNGWVNIEEPGFGKGYAAEQSIWGEFIKKILQIKKAGFYVVLISHVKVKTEPGVVTDSYPRYRFNLRDDAGNAIFDNSDIVAFLSQRVSIKKEDAGFKKTNNRGEGGGEVVISVQERPGFVAKNRYDMKASFPFKKGTGFAEIAKYLPCNENHETESEAA